MSFTDHYPINCQLLFRFFAFFRMTGHCEASFSRGIRGFYFYFRVHSRAIGFSWLPFRATIDFPEENTVYLVDLLPRSIWLINIDS
jgi:hypothetical protein